MTDDILTVETYLLSVASGSLPIMRVQRDIRQPIGQALSYLPVFVRGAACNTILESGKVFGTNALTLLTNAAASIENYWRGLRTIGLDRTDACLRQFVSISSFILVTQEQNKY